MSKIKLSNVTIPSIAAADSVAEEAVEPFVVRLITLLVPVNVESTFPFSSVNAI